MSDSLDSWEKIEQDIRGNCECAGGKPCDPPHTGPHCIYQGELDEWADRLRALRERDEKRWEIVHDVEKGIEAATTITDGTSPALTFGEIRAWATVLREARELP